MLVHMEMLQTHTIKMISFFSQTYSNGSVFQIQSTLTWCLVPERVTLFKQAEQHSGVKQSVFKDMLWEFTVPSCLKAFVRENICLLSLFSQSLIKIHVLLLQNTYLSYLL